MSPHHLGSDAIGHNWADSYTYQAARLLRPGSVEEVQDVVESEPRIRALGSRHSFTGLPDSAGSLISLDGLPPRIDIDLRSVAKRGRNPVVLLRVKGQ